MREGIQRQREMARHYYIIRDAIIRSKFLNYLLKGMFYFLGAILIGKYHLGNFFCLIGPLMQIVILYGLVTLQLTI